MIKTLFILVVHAEDRIDTTLTRQAVKSFDWEPSDKEINEAISGRESIADHNGLLRAHWYSVEKRMYYEAPSN